MPAPLPEVKSPGSPASPADIGARSVDFGLQSLNALTTLARHLELANGYNGYLPTPQQHRLGGYETWRARSSYLEAEAAPKISDTVMALFARLKGTR